MKSLHLTCAVLAGFAISPFVGAGETRWPDAVEQQLAKAKDNRKELEAALNGATGEQRKGMEFLIANMPDVDLVSLKADFLKTNVELAYKARRELPWGKDIPEAIFLNNVLPYANVDEKRDPWRQEFWDLALPIVKACKSPAEATQKLNAELFPKIKVKYAPQRRSPNLSPKESMAQGNASCTGLSILLSDACRAVCVPTRVVGTPNWWDKRGNHAWLEIWDKDWHFLGACEPDPNGLNRGWFVGDAAKAKKDSPEHAIYAASFAKTDIHFPLVWARANKTIPGVNVTDRYAKPEPAKTTARLSIRVFDASGKRIAEPVEVSPKGEPKPAFTGKSRGESADLNDYFTLELPPNADFVIRVQDVEKAVRTGAVGSSQIVDVSLDKRPTPPKSPQAVPVDAGKSAKAVADLKAALKAKPADLSELARRDFASVGLTKCDSAEARKSIWDAHVAHIRETRAAEIKEKVLRDGKLEMPFEYRTFGKKPAGGRSLWISLHGGGGAPKQVNDSQWRNQIKLYTVDEGIYLAPRAPTNTWNLWHEAHIDRLFTRLIEDLIVLEDVNPDRVYVLGYSAGGDGVYQIGPRMADQWAGAAMMAGHPNGVSMLSLRNVPFALQVGGNDSAYNRNKVGREYGEQLKKLREADPKGYENFVKIHEGKGHWMNLEDKAALPWLAKFTRNPLPDRVVWKQTGTPHDRLYWLATPEPKVGSLVIATHDSQKINIEKTENVGKLVVRLSDAMANLDQPVIITHAGRMVSSAIPQRCISTLLTTLVGRGDPQMMFDATVQVDLGGK